MSTVQKIALSLLVAVLVFSGLAVAAFSGLFSYIETTFYDPRVRDSVERTLDRAHEVVETYQQTVFDRFSAALGESAVRNIYRVNQSREDIVWRDSYFGELRERMPAFAFVRFVDLEAERLWFSTLPEDILRQDATSRVFRPIVDIDDLPVNFALPTVGVDRDLVLMPSGNMFVYRFLVRDGFDIPRGTALFSVSPFGLRSALIRADVIGSGDVIRLVPEGIILNATVAGGDQIVEQLSRNWSSIVDGSLSPTAVETSDGARRLVFSREAGSARLLLLVPESDFLMNTPMKVVLLVSGFLTTFLVAFLLLNLRQDASVVLSDRVKRFQINFLREYMESKEDLNWERWSKELESRREEIRTELKRGVSGLKGSKGKEVDELFDKSWDEILNVIGTRRQISRGSEGIDLDRLESMIERVVSNLSTAPGSADPSVQRTPDSVEKISPPSVSVSEDSEPEELEEMEELEEVETSDAAVDSPSPEALDEVEELEELDELVEVEETEELAEVSAPANVEDPGRSDVVEDDSELEEMEELEALDDLEELEELAVDDNTMHTDEDLEELGGSESVDVIDEGLEENVTELLEAADEDHPSSLESLNDVGVDHGIDNEIGAETSSQAGRKPPEFGIMETDSVLETSLGEMFADTRHGSDVDLFGEGSAAEAISENEERGDQAYEEPVELESLDLEDADLDFSDLEPVATGESEPPVRADTAVGSSASSSGKIAADPLADEESGDTPVTEELWKDLESIREDWESPPSQMAFTELPTVVPQPAAVVDPDGNERLSELESVDDQLDDEETVEALSNIYGGFTFGLFGFGDQPAASHSGGAIGQDDDAELLEELEENLEELDEIDEPGEIEGDLEELDELEEIDDFDEPAEVDELEEIDELEEMDSVDETDGATETVSSPGGGTAGGSPTIANSVLLSTLSAASSVQDDPVLRSVLGGSTNAYEIVDLSTVLEFLGDEGEIIEETDGIVQISGRAFEQSRASVEEVGDLISGMVGDDDPVELGIDDILSIGGGLDLMPMGPIGERIESRVPRSQNAVDERNDGKGLVFSERGLNYDLFLSRFKRNEGGLYKSLIEFTRIWNAKFSAIMVEKSDALQVDYLLGLEDPCVNYLRIGRDTPLYQKVIGERRILMLKRTLKHYDALHVNCSDVEFEYIGCTVFLPIVFRGNPSYLMLGLGDTVPTVQTFFELLLNQSRQMAIV